jgi:vacuolar-type H+-ATPase subunit I/STV1
LELDIVNLLSFRAKLDTKIEALETQFQSYNADYSTAIEQRISKLWQETTQDESDQKTIELNNRRLSRLQVVKIDSKVNTSRKILTTGEPKWQIT